MATWMKVETRVRSHPKIAETIKETQHADAAWLWFAGNAYCRDALTDGFISDAMLSTLVPSLPARVLKGLPDVLVTHGLWHREAGGYRVHDWLEHNPSKAEAEEYKRKDRERKRRGERQESDTGSQADSERNPSDSRAGGRPTGASSLSSSGSSGSATTPEVVPGSPAPRGPKRHGDPFGMRPPTNAAALVRLDETGRVMEIHQGWAERVKNDYRLSDADIRAFAAWLGEKLRAAGGRVEDGGKRFRWLDQELALWRTPAEPPLPSAQDWIREQEAVVAALPPSTAESRSAALREGFQRGR